jgi:hypothetical protein
LLRVLPTLLVLGLLAGTAAAFAITEGLKLERSPITRTRITKIISPACDCEHASASIRFFLRKADTVRVTVVDSGGDVVKTLTRRHFGRGVVQLRWNGRDGDGVQASGGGYRVRVHLARRHQTITIPNTIRVDSTPPTITLTSVRPAVISPNHDGRADYATIRFHVSESARPLLYVDGKLAGRGQLASAAGAFHWFGKIDGRRARAGSYRITLRAEDQAGNVSPPTSADILRIRFVELGRKVIRAAPGRRFSVRVTTDAKTVRWLLHARTGQGSSHTLVLRAPKRPGRYRLFVTAADRSQTALVVVAK